jgi:GT2 family glycosyltransferase
MGLERMRSNQSLPLVSIIIPTYNRSRLLQEAVESALAQTYPNVEVIVVDDGSADDTAQVMAQYDDRLCYIRQANRGVAAARNTGIRASRGEYLTFLDDDDRFLRTKVQRQVHLLSSQPKSGLVHCRYYRADGEGHFLDKPSLLPQGEILDSLVRWNFVWIGGPLVRRECFERVGVFDENGPQVTADWDMWLRIALAGYEFGCVQRPVGVYRIHPESMMSNVHNLERGTIHVLEKAFANPALPEQIAVSRSQTLALVRLWLGSLYHNAGHWEDGRRNMAIAIELCPQLLQKPAQIAQLFCNIAMTRRIADPLQFVADVLDHLPATAVALHSYRPYIMNSIYVRLAMRSYSTGDVARAQEQLDRALDLGGDVSSQTHVISGPIVHAALQLPVHDPIRHIRRVLQNLPARARSCRGLRAATLHRAYAKLAQEASLSHSRRRAIRYILLAVLYRPFSVQTWKLALMLLRRLAKEHADRRDAKAPAGDVQDGVWSGTLYRLLERTRIIR